jgi:Zn-dependent M32 family carboxypeptidase
MYDAKIMCRWLKAKSIPIIHPSPIQQVLHNTMGELFFEHQILQIFKELGLGKEEVKVVRNRQQADEIRMRFVSSLVNRFGASLQEAQKSWTFIKSRAPFTYRYSYLSKIVNETLKYEYESRK